MTRFLERCFLYQSMKKEVTEEIMETTFNHQNRSQKKENGIRDYLWIVTNHQWKRNFLTVFLIYLTAVSSILRANYLYVDDIRRTADGQGRWSVYSRYLSDVLAHVIHGGNYLCDIAPLPQILAILLLSLGASCLLHIEEQMHKMQEKKSEQKIFLTGFSVMPLALFPFYLQCLSYRYDAVYMALSVVSGIFPFCYIEKDWKKFRIFSFVGALFMCMTYQASSGIYPMLLVFCLCCKWNKKELRKDFFKEMIWGAMMYLGGLLVFRIFFMKPFDTYVSSKIYSISSLISGMASNYQQYYHTMRNLSRWQILLSLFLFGSFIGTFIINSRQKKKFSFFLAIGFLFIESILSVGMYIILEKTMFLPRTMYGFGFFQTLLAIYVVNHSREIISKIIVIFLGWSYFAFSFTFGNALYEQKEYTENQIILLMNSLDNLDQLNHERNIHITGNIGRSPILENMIQNGYEILIDLVPYPFGNGWGSNLVLTKYYNCQNLRFSDQANDITKMKLLKENQFFRIYGEEDHLEIVYRNAWKEPINEKRQAD